MDQNIRCEESGMRESGGERERENWVAGGDDGGERPFSQFSSGIIEKVSNHIVKREISHGQSGPPLKSPSPQGTINTHDPGHGPPPKDFRHPKKAPTVCS